MANLTRLSPTIFGVLLAAGIAIWHAAAFADKPGAVGADATREPALVAAEPIPSDKSAPEPLKPLAPAARVAESIEPIGSDEPGDSVKSFNSAKTIGTVESATPSMPLAPEAIDEILRLRRLIGGDSNRPAGAERLASEEQFREALRELSGGGPKRSAVPTSEAADAAPRLDEARHTKGDEPELIPAVPRTELTDSPPPAPGAHDLEYGVDPDRLLIAQMRDTSRAMDNRAHDYEAERRFDEADTLRRLAGRLRRTARDLERTALHLDATRASP